MKTRTRERLLGFARERILEGFPPTVREAQEYLGLGHVKSAQEQIDRLVRDGLLERIPGVSRGLRLPGQTGKESHAAHIPLLGRVQAGALQTAMEDIEAYILVEGRYEVADLFGLRVKGESMVGMGILPNDIVVVRSQPNAENGQVVVALVGDESTVKVFHRRGRRIELRPANPAFPVLRPDPERLSILGLVIEVRRSLA